MSGLPSENDDFLIEITNNEHLEQFSAPTKPIYINHGVEEGSRLIGPISRSLATVEELNPRGIAIDHRNHFPNLSATHSSVRNRYPYFQRVAAHRTGGTNRSSVSAPMQIGRRAFFPARRQRIPIAPPLPKYLTLENHSRLSLTSTIELSKNGDEQEQIPTRSFWVILRLVFFFFAIEFMYAIETALTVPILMSLKVEEKYFSMAWLISPILGFFLQPIVGMWSDTCRSRWGRRRPFILAFAIGAYLGITLLLNAADLGILLGDSEEPRSTPSKAILITIIGVTFLDFCADSADAPIRAYLIDTTNPSDQERGFNIHAILGFGGGLGFIIGAIKINPISWFLGKGNFFVIFIVISFLFIVCTASTLTSIREEPLVTSSRSNSEATDNPDENELKQDIYNDDALNENQPLLSQRNNTLRSSNSINRSQRHPIKSYFSSFTNEEGYVEIDVATGTQIPHDYVEQQNDDILLQTLERSDQTIAVSAMTNDPNYVGPVPAQEFEIELKKKAKLVKLGLLRRPIIESDDDDNEKVTLKSMLRSMIHMPPRLWKLMILQMFGWIAYFASHMYFTDFMGKAIYGGNEETIDGILIIDEKYDEGVKMGCWGLLVYALSGAIYAFSVERWLTEKFELETLYFIGNFIYALGCIVNFYVHSVYVNVIMCFTFGIMVVTLNTLPYYMLSNFHADETYRNKDGSRRGIGIDCSLLNSCYFLGELIISAILSPIVDSFGVNSVMFVGAFTALLTNAFMVFLFYYVKAR